MAPPKKGQSGQAAVSPAEEAVFLSLRDDIMSQRLSPGEPLREEALAERFGVSRTPIRAALKRLSWGGLVSYQKNFGCRVAKPQLAEVEPAFWLRAQLEGLAAAEAARRATAGQVRALTALLERERAAFAAHSMGDILAVSFEFHMTIARMAGNELLERFIRELNERTSVHVAFYDFLGADTPRSPSEHADVVAAIRRHDPAAARRTMEAHILSTRKHLRVAE